MKTIERGQALPYGLARVKGSRDCVSKFCFRLPVWTWRRRGYDINNDLMVEGWGILSALLTLETFHHASLRVAIHFAWVPSSEDRLRAVGP